MPSSHSNHPIHLQISDIQQNKIHGIHCVYTFFMETIQIHKAGKSLHRTNDYQVINKLCNCSELNVSELLFAEPCTVSMAAGWRRRENKVCWWQSFLWLCRRRWYANGLHTSPDGVCLCPWLHRWGQRRVCACVCVGWCVCVSLRGMYGEKDKMSGYKEKECPLPTHSTLWFSWLSPQDVIWFWGRRKMNHWTEKLDWFFCNNCFFFCCEILTTFQPQLWRKKKQKQN